METLTRQRFLFPFILRNLIRFKKGEKYLEE